MQQRRFVVLKNGVIASIYDSKGAPFARSRSWQANTSGGTPRVTESMGKQSELKPEVQTSGSAGRGHET
ncbi:MAG: hypothetical protein M3347_06685 [Armatimonadota bacterium]|nr:hypothetical protein [Armatimonadota bacterium]